jgi:hypothetical protein
MSERSSGQTLRRAYENDGQSLRDVGWLRWAYYWSGDNPQERVAADAGRSLLMGEALVEQ